MRESGLKELSQSPKGNGTPSEGLGMEKGARAWSRCAVLNNSGCRGESELEEARADCTGGPRRQERRVARVTALECQWSDPDQGDRCLGSKVGRILWWIPSAE